MSVPVPTPSGRTGLWLRWMLAACAPLLLAGVPLPARAVQHPDAKIVVHLVPKSDLRKRNCYAHGVTELKDLRTQGELSPAGGEPIEYMAYVLITDFNPEVGITAVQFGVVYDETPEVGVDILGWQDCALMEWHNEDWPLPGTGNLLTWNQNVDCQSEGPVVVGFFTVMAHSDDVFKIIPRPVDDIASVAACGLNAINSKDYVDEIPREHLGWAGFGAGKGYNPWDPAERRTPAEPAGTDGN